MARKPDNQASIANVAALAGVSTATVSRVLSGSRLKNDAISKRVHTAAKQLHYSANFAASALRSERTRTLGLILPGAANGPGGIILDLLSRRLTEEGRYLMVVSAADDQARETAIRSMSARQVEGIILAPSPDEDHAGIADDLGDGIPLVQIGGRPLSYHTNWVGMDQTASMRLTIGHLAEQDVQAVAFLSRELDTSASIELFTTFSTLTGTLGIAPEPEWIQFGPCNMQRGYDATLSMLTKGRTHPDAIVCGDDTLALGALMACQELDIAVPDKVKVATFTDSPACLVSKPTLTAIKAPLAGIVEEALRLLDSNGQTILPRHVSLPPELVCRESTRSPLTDSDDMTQPGAFTY